MRPNPPHGWDVKSIECFVFPTSMRSARPSTDHFSRVVQTTEKIVLVEVENLSFTVRWQCRRELDLQPQVGPVGRSQWGKLLNLKVLSEDNVVTLVMGVSRDVTDRKRAQEALRRARDELEMRVKERTADLQKANELLKKQIEERIRAEEKLKESEEKYRGLFENSGEAVFIVDTESGIILDANRQAEQLTGQPRQELIGTHQSRLHPAEDAEYYRKKFQQHIKNDLVFDLEAEIVKKDGSVVPVFISSNLIDLWGKKIIQGIFRDISKEKMISDLKGELEARKLINRAKAIIANHYKINDSDAMRLLQKESRKQSRKLKEVAQAVISSKFILD